MSKRHNPGCLCCGCTPPTCSLTGAVTGSQILLTWTVGGTAPITAVLSSDTGDVYTLTVPPNTGTVLTPVSSCRLWTLNVSNACGSTSCQVSESSCVDIYLRTEECESCTDFDYPTSLITPLRQIQISISGVTGGTNSAAPNFYFGALSDPPGFPFLSEEGPVFGAEPGRFFNDLGACEVSALGENADFFNGSYILDPCTEVLMHDCRYICSAKVTIPAVVDAWADFYEWNRMFLNYQSAGSGKWNIGIQMESWLYMIQSPYPDGVTPDIGDHCDTPALINIDPVTKRPVGSSGITPFTGGIYAWHSYRSRVLSFELNAGVKKGHWYDPATCAGGCNPDVDLAACLTSGLATSTPTDTIDFSYYCTKAVNVNSGSAVIAVLP